MQQCPHHSWHTCRFVPRAPTKPTSEVALLVALNDGARRVTLDEHDNLQGLPAVPPAYEQLVKTALREERLTTPAVLQELRGRTSVLLGKGQDESAFALHEPVGIALRPDRPTFRWQAVAGATSYSVAVLDADFQLIATSPALSEATWTPAQPLSRNRMLLWQVSAQTPERAIIAPAAPAAEARFSILSTAQARELQHAVHAYRDSHLLLGVLYARAGLLKDAEAELQTLRAVNQQVPLAEKLLRQVQSLRR